MARQADRRYKKKRVRRELKLYLVPIVVLLALTLPHLEQGEFRRDTVRYAAVGLHMWQGGDLLVPHLNPDRPYFNKPPMAFWIHGAFLKMFGANLIAARVPSILAAIGVLAFSMLAARGLTTAREAIVSGIVLATTYEFFRRTREISLDLWQLFFVMIAVWFAAKAIREDKSRALIVAGMPLGCALLCKPLVALAVIPMFAVWSIVARRTKLIPALGLTLIIAVAVAAPWHLAMWHEFGSRFTAQYFVQEIVQRAKRTDQPTNALFYLVQNIQTYWPWLIALIYGVYLRVTRTQARSSRRDLVLLGGIWVVITLTALSAFADRKPNYALPIYPMLSWIAAFGLCRIRWAALRRWYEHGLPWLAPAAVALSIVAAFAPIRFQEPPEQNWVRLLQWMTANRIDPAELVYKNIDQSDVDYVYLKTGRWMRSFKAAPRDRPLIVVQKIYDLAKKPPQGEVLFSSGPVYVVKQGD